MRSLHTITTRCIGLLLIPILVGALQSHSVQAAHPFHVCVAQMEWNASSQLWEVSIRVHPQDLERVLSQKRGKPTSIEDRDFPELVIPFLDQQFAIVDAPKSMSIQDLIAAIDRKESLPTSELRWIGMEPERGWLWIHLEMTPPKETAGQSWLLHRIFLDQIDRQENSVRIVDGTNRYALQFKRGQESQPMKGSGADSKDSARTQSPGN
jgi:hypothetical protein